ncbi:hypothetical protein [Arthrobacter sp.]|uniref:hypothetical protein n=1 Tax=Arthrobacter sp. TaxID=1667 RepID=UPI003A90867E
MTTKKVAAVRNAKTGSYTVYVQKSASSGKFVSQTVKPGRIEVRLPSKKAG